MTLKNLLGNNNKAKNDEVLLPSSFNYQNPKPGFFKSFPDTVTNSRKVIQFCSNNFTLLIQVSILTYKSPYAFSDMVLPDVSLKFSPKEFNKKRRIPSRTIWKHCKTG